MSSPLIDISPMLSPTTAVWPGDTSLGRDVQMRLENGDSVELSSLLTTVHVGAHADAPSHYLHGATSIEAVSLEAYVGPCQVITVENVSLIEPKHFAARLGKNISRILFRTLSFPDPNHFNENFAAISPETMRYLGEQRFQLVGIDTPSIDPFTSKTLEAHQQLLKAGLRNLEGLVLEHVKDGTYELIALPLKLLGFDASPVRAVLRHLHAIETEV